MCSVSFFARFPLRLLPGAALALIGALIGMSTALAAPAGAPVAVPRTPTLSAPQTGRVLESAPAGTWIGDKFAWTESALPDPSALPTDYFLFCIFDAAAGQRCGWPGTLSAAQSPIITLTPSVGSLSRDEIWTPRPPLAPQLSAWRYSMYPGGTLPFSAGTRRLQWTIAACSGASKPICASAAPRELSVTPHDLKLARIRDGFGIPPDDIEFTAIVRNDGHVSAGPHITTLKVWRVLRETNCTAQTDFRRANVPAGARVITTRGQELTVAEAAAGSEVYVLGIWVPDSDRASRSMQHESLSQGVDTPEVTLGFVAPPLAQRPVLFLTWATVGLSNGQLDFNPTNDVRSQMYCRQ